MTDQKLMTICNYNKQFFEKDEVVELQLEIKNI